MPGLVVAWYVTETPISAPIATEIIRYLFARQNPEDGGWGLHIEGQSSVFGTVMNYVVLRILGESEEDSRMIKARAQIHRLGGAVQGPHWLKFWLSVLGVMEWEAVNPTPPELWYVHIYSLRDFFQFSLTWPDFGFFRLVPDWIPIAPWRWWIHIRQVFLPMSFISSKRFSFPLTALTRQLREELYIQPYSSINFAACRNSISPRDNFHPKTGILNTLNWALANIWYPYIRPSWLVRRGEEWTYRLICYEAQNTDYASLGPVNAPMNMLAAYIQEGEGSYPVKRFRDRLHDFLWMKNEGMLMNGTNGVQTWDTLFLIQAVVEAGLAGEERWRPMLLKALEFLEDQQIREDCVDQNLCYRQRRKGAWAFSTRDQGYTVSDCTSEALKSVILLQRRHGFPTLVSDSRLEDAVDTLLTMQNASGGFASYEPTRGSEYMEYLNAAEVFGRIMVEYDYPECTTAVVTGLSLFSEEYPEYRKDDIEKAISKALKYIRKAQRADGSWYGSWGICFTYAGMFAAESLASVGETYSNSDRLRKACEFLLSKQMADGGWGESYRSCEICEYVPHANSQVVNTCWAIIGLLVAGYPEREPLERAVRMVMGRQQSTGGWKQEAIEGVFNKSW